MAASVEIRAPAEQTEGTRSQVLRWLKSVGEAVTENEPLIELETDKVTVEVPAPASGILREILKHEQEEVAPGELLGRLESAASEAASQTAGAATATAGHARVEVQQARSDAAGPADTSASGRLSPAVRRLIAEHGLDVSTIRGTGQGGRITVEDVLRAAGAAPAKAAANVGHKAETVAATAEEGGRAGSRRVPHTAVRKRIAEHMVQSLLRTAPHVTSIFEADMSAVLAHRARHKDDFAARGAPLTLTAYFLAAAVEAIRAVPEANSTWTEDALEIYDAMHIGVATALDTGLVVPVLRNVESRDLFEIARGLNDLVTRARSGTLTPADVRGGTFTISNHGVSGSLVAAPIIINQPQSAILGVGKLEKRPVVVEVDGEDRIVVQPRCYVTLTIDHRVLDGHQANRFLQVFVQHLERWPPQ